MPETAFDPSTLPAPVRTYLEAHASRDFAAMSGILRDDAVVVDEGVEHVGPEAIRAWLGRAASQFTYTEELRSQARTGDAEWTVVNHLEGDFPGGVVDLRFVFELDGDALERLTIAP